MPINILQPVSPALALQASSPHSSIVSRGVDRGFGATLGASLGAVGSPDDARKAAEEFVSIAFIEPVLKSLRESNNAAPPFAPTAAEKSFGPLLDAEIAQRIVAHERYGLVKAVARQLLSASGGATDAATEIDTNA